MNRFDWCKSYTMLSAEQFESLDAGIETAEMTKEGNCYVGRYCSIILPVHTKPNNTLVGYVKFLGFCEAFCNIVIVVKAAVSLIVVKAAVLYVRAVVRKIVAIIIIICAISYHRIEN